MTKKTMDYKHIALCIMVCVIPIIMIFVLLKLEGKTFSDMIPVWGDEVWWWQQANAVGKFGRPLGYWGYNGGRAAIGTFATWGPAAVMPYGLYAFLFGWEYHSYIYANCFYMCLATALFIYAAKPDIKSLIVLLLVNMVQVVRNYYMLTAMQETMRYAMGLIAVALLMLLVCNEKTVHWTVKYILVPGYLLFSTWAFLPHIIFIFAYLLLLHKQINIKSVIMAGTETLVITFVMRRFMRLFSTPYISASRSFFSRVVSNVRGALALFASENVDVFFKWYHGVYLSMIIILTMYLVFNWKKTIVRDRMLMACADFILIAYQAGWIGFYDTTLWTYTRGISVGLLLATFLLCLCRKKTPVVVFLLFCCVGLPSVDNVENTFLNNRFKTPRWETTVKNTSDYLERNLVLQKDASDPWMNTVQTYGTGSSVDKKYVTLCLPAGFSANSMSDKAIRGKAGWIVIEKPNDIAENGEWLQFCEMGYECCLDNSYLMIFRKNDIQ